MTTLSDFAKQLLDALEVATVATILPDGRPQQSVIWVKRDGDDVLFSTTRPRRKTKNIAADDRVGVLLFPKDDPYHYVEIRRRASITDDPTGSLIQELSQKYVGQDWAIDDADQRIIVRVTPEKLVSH